MNLEQAHQLHDSVVKQLRAMRPDLYEHCVKTGIAAQETVEQGYSAAHVGQLVERATVLTLALALNIRAVPVEGR